MTTIKSILPQSILPIRLDRFVYEYGDTEITLEATTPLQEESVCLSLNFSDLNTLLLQIDADVREQLEDALAGSINSQMPVSFLDVKEVTETPIFIFFPELHERVVCKVQLRKAS